MELDEKVRKRGLVRGALKTEQHLKFEHFFRKNLRFFVSLAILF